MKFEVYGNDRVHGAVIHLPALPRPGDSVLIDGRMYTVIRLQFIANNDTIMLTIEE